jgi:hypothetical protein
VLTAIADLVQGQGGVLFGQSVRAGTVYVEHNGRMDEACNAAYRARLAQGLLKPNPAQALAAEKLESLHHALADYRPGKGEGWLARFGLARPEEPPLGLYLFGPEITFARLLNRRPAKVKHAACHAETPLPMASRWGEGKCCFRLRTKGET